MNIKLAYIDKKGAHTIMNIKPIDIESMLIKLSKRNFNATIWKEGNRNNELGGTFKHPEVGWSWYYDSDILK